METITTIKPELLTLTAEQVTALMPFFLLIGGALLATIITPIRSLAPKWLVFLVSLVATGAAFMSSWELLSAESVVLFNNMMVSDRYSNFFNLIFSGSAFLTILASFRYLDNEDLQHPEYYLLIMFSTIGMMVMGASKDLVVMFIALEVMSLAIYTLVGFRRSDRRSNEAAIKYFIMGGVGSAIFLYGVALLYGVTASTNIKTILAYVQNPEASASFSVFVVGGWLILTGFLFKVASVPFHMWMPDVYEGAPTPVTGFMTSGLKAASFAAFLRVFVSMGYGKGMAAMIESHIHDILWVAAVLTMIVGNVIALTQHNLKRMLGYSSIAHTGYLLVGLLAGARSEQGYAPVMMYLVAYAVMNIGAFVVLTVMSEKRDAGLNLADLSGAAKRYPWLAFSMAVFMFSMAGVPPTAGFVAKYLLFYSAIQSGEVLLVVISVLCSAISVYYYLRVLLYMYMREPLGAAPAQRVPIWAAAALAGMVVLTFHVGLLPAGLVEAAKQAVTSL